MTDLESLSNRLRILENRSRRARVLGVIASIFVAALGLMGQGPGRLGESDIIPQRGLKIETQAAQARAILENEVRSQHFVLMDENGKERASLSADRAGSVFLVMFDAGGKNRVNLSLTPQGPSLAFYDPSGQARTILGSTSTVASRISENGIVERAPASSIVLFDKNGRLLSRAP
jgi:hypothetical protein